MSKIRNKDRTPFDFQDGLKIKGKLLSDSNGADEIGVNDGNTGSLFTTLNGFLTKLKSTVGAALIGFKQAGTGAVTRTVEDKLNESVSVKDFGAKGDGITDDGPAFNLALAISQSVSVPPGNYLIKTQIVSDTAGSLYGTGGVTPFTVTAPGPRLIYHPDLGTSPMLWIKESKVLSNLGFSGPEKGTGIAIRNRKDIGIGVTYEDMDVTIQGCYFESWQTAVEHYNRGLTLLQNNVALVGYGVNLFWDDANFVDDTGNQFDTKTQGFRAIRIENNRFHANNVAINNTGADALYLRGLKVLGNHIDIGDQLFNGGLYSGVFCGNVIDQTSASLGAIQITSATQEVVISGNQINGDLIQGIPTQLIGFSSSAKEVTITGNSLKNASAYGISFGGAVVGATISGNTISEVGTAGNTTRACIRFISTANDVAINGNYFNPTTDAYCIRGSTGLAWSGVTIQGNTWNRSRILSGAYSDSGNNSIQT